MKKYYYKRHLIFKLTAVVCLVGFGMLMYDTVVDIFHAYFDIVISNFHEYFDVVDLFFKELLVFYVIYIKSFTIKNWITFLIIIPLLLNWILNFYNKVIKKIRFKWSISWKKKYLILFTNILISHIIDLIVVFISIDQSSLLFWPIVVLILQIIFVKKRR